ncbi:MULTISPECIES: hypothetical protein [Paenibacillus]|uniref:hypothetical protein n=1 Tax=Paenibacillus TaxID=44249 RepID=UPI000B279CC3|nr:MULTISPECIES: hypothetical protein [Paenibacillus]NEN84143.1 hypothetical protein [Paenibacillus elgii]
MDLTLVLKRLLELGWRETFVAVIVDAAAWEMCSKQVKAGVSDSVSDGSIRHLLAVIRS